MPDWKPEIRRRLAGLHLTPTREAAIVEELAQYLDDCYAEILSSGATEVETDRAALAELSEGEVLARELRRVERQVAPEPIVLGTHRRTNMIADLWQDLRYGARMLMKNRSFTLIAVLTLALGIGANTVIFSVVNAVVFLRLPFNEAERLVLVGETDARGRPGGASPANYLDWQQQSRALEQVAAKLDWSGYDLTGGADPEQVIGVPVSASIFPLLKVQPMLGRTFLPEEDRPGGSPVVLLSYRLWQRRFNSDPKAVGETLALNGNPHIIIGVMPAGFYLNRDTVSVAETDQLWVPLAQQLGVARMAWRQTRNLRVWARLKPGVSLAQAQAEMEIIQRQLQLTYPADGGERGVKVLPLSEWRAEQVRRTYGLLRILLGAVGFVLLIACANVANLQLARAATRTQEIAVRLAVGAGRLRLLRQLLTESLLLATLGTTVGLLLAFWEISVLPALVPDNLRIPRLDQSVIDQRVFAFTILLTMVVSVICGIAPALQAGKTNLQEALQSGARSATAGLRGRRLRGFLVSAEVALALVLLIGAGLLMRSFVQLLQVEPGFDPKQVLTLKIPAPDRPADVNPADIQQREMFMRALLERLQTLPGVRAVGVTDRLPLTGGATVHRFTIANNAEPVPPQATTHIVSADYFRTLNIPLKRGRLFDQHEGRELPAVAVISETMARRYWPNADPLGQQIRQEGPDSNQLWSTVIGVVGDIKENQLSLEAAPAVYWSHLQLGTDSMGTTLVLRTEAAPQDVIPAARRAIAELEQKQPIAQVLTMEEVIANSVSPQRFNLTLIGVLAAIALWLAVAGIYGVMTYSVSQRTHELGLRIALGAQTRDVLKLVIRQGMELVLLGAAIGIAGAIALTRVMKNLLFGVSATDLLTFIVISSLLIVVALLACWLPARRATKVDPMIALRAE